MQHLLRCFLNTIALLMWTTIKWISYGHVTVHSRFTFHKRTQLFSYVLPYVFIWDVNGNVFNFNLLYLFSFLSFRIFLEPDLWLYMLNSLSSHLSFNFGHKNIADFVNSLWENDFEKQPVCLVIYLSSEILKRHFMLS